MEKIRVLVVDDSAFMRRYISDLINQEPDMEVIDTAAEGDSAIEKVKLLNPDVVTLDVEMPGKNGLEVLREIKKISPTEVIMLSGLTKEGSAVTVEALGIGAFDFVEKPGRATLSEMQDMKRNLVDKIRYAWRAKGKKSKIGVSVKERIPSKKSLPHITLTGRIEAIVLGASTGGPKVLYDIITAFPKDLDIPVFVVQHMPAGFTKAFADRLDKNSSLRVIEAQNEDIIKPGVVYIAPGGYHMTVISGKIILDTSPPIHGVRPAADKLFISAAEVYKNKLICCVFTGMGRDGAEGLRIIKSRGGITIAQDESTSVIYGMPKAAYETGCVDLVLPDYEIAETIVKLVKESRNS